MKYVVATFVSALLCCWSLAAKAQQFDLECGYGEGTEVDDKGSGYAFGSPKHVQVDLAEGIWCEDYCSSYDRYEVISANGLEVILATQDTHSGFHPRSLIYNRETGALSETTFKNGRQTDLQYPCEVAQFGGFETSKLRSASAPLSRMMGAMLSKEGKKVGKLAPEGRFDVFVRFEIDAEGKALSCEAMGETPLPELEEATCTFLIDGDFQFYPATNRDGEAVTGEYRTTVIFAN